VSVDAWDTASYNFSVGGTVDLRYGNSGNPLSSVVIPAGANTAAGVAALINGVHPNGAFVVNGSLKLFDLAYVEVNALGSILSAELGLSGTPALPTVRDVANVALLSRLTDFSLQFDRNDVFSNPVPVPDGANAMSLWMSTYCFTSLAVECQNPHVIVTFSNGVDLNPADKLFYSLGGLSDPTPQVLTVPEVSVRGNPKLAMALYDGVPMIGPSPVLVGHPPQELVIPPGATSVRISVVPPPWGATLPIRPPSVMATGVNFAVR
jgi:hypothetical protein